MSSPAQAVLSGTGGVYKSPEAQAYFARRWDYIHGNHEYKKPFGIFLNRFGSGVFNAARAAAQAFKEQEEGLANEVSDEPIEDEDDKVVAKVYVPSFDYGEPSPYYIMFRRRGLVVRQ